MHPLTYAKAHLQVEDLSFYRNYKVIFQNIHFQLHNSEILHLKGANGAGKTTLLRILSSLSHAKTGHVLFNQTNIHDLAHIYHQNILYIGHQLGLKDELTPQENLHALLKIKRLNVDPTLVLEALNRLSIGKVNRPVRSLSAGQKRRVALARLWLEPAVLWLLDEPFTALDKETISLLEEKFQQQQSQQGMIILTSHQNLSSHLSTQFLQL